jgi:lipopolysaccharide export LptBFGC system permease protein LptF
MKKSKHEEVCKYLSRLKLIPEFSKKIYQLLNEQYETNEKLKIKKYKVYLKQDDKYYLNPILYNRIINGKLNKTINNNDFFKNFDLKEHTIPEETLKSVVNLARG